MKRPSDLPPGCTMNDVDPLEPRTRPKSIAAKLAAKLRRQGFDKSYATYGHVYLMCSQCNALAINGVACHEKGCPNAKTKK